PRSDRDRRDPYFDFAHDWSALVVLLLHGHLRDRSLPALHLVSELAIPLQSPSSTPGDHPPGSLVWYLCRADPLAADGTGADGTLGSHFGCSTLPGGVSDQALGTQPLET